jgi:hypothetical protein
MYLKSNKQKYEEKKIVDVLKVGYWRKWQDPDPHPDPLVRGMDPHPDPYRNFMDPQHWLGDKIDKILPV